MTDVVSIERDASVLEADRLGDHPHPREVLWYGGDPAAEQALLDAYRSGRLHHAWLLTGPEGVGKATLAYRFARFLLAHPDPSSRAVHEARDLAVPDSHAVVGQVARLSHPDLSVIRRQPTKDGKSLKGDIAVEDVRDGLALFRTTAGAGGWRVVIIDAADDLNRSSANALLKMLEEPPQRAIFLLIAHRPGALLPTIRSRCRVLRLAPLPEATVADGLVRLASAAPDVAAEAAAKADGSLRQAFAALDPALRAVRGDLAKLLADPARIDGKAAMALAEKTQGKAKVETFEAVLEALEAHLRARVAALAGGDRRILAAFAELWEKLRRSARDVETYNLDRRPFILSVLSDLAEIERRARA
jgi:DNA polymerase-3 subunit delta'